MDKWECPCGYIYDPEEGDAESNIQIGTAFEDLPEDWVRPHAERKRRLSKNSTEFSRPF